MIHLTRNYKENSIQRKEMQLKVKFFKSLMAQTII